MPDHAAALSAHTEARVAQSTSVQVTRAPQVQQHTTYYVTHMTLDEIQKEDDWPLFRKTWGCRGFPQFTTWYRACGPVELRYPPMFPQAKSDDIFIYHCVSRPTKMWVLNTDRLWVDIHVGDPQPTNAERVLILRGKGDPSWVKRATMLSYRYRFRHEVREYRSPSMFL